MKKAGHVNRVEIVKRDDLGSAPERPFLSLHRLHVRNTYSDGERSRVYGYDAVLRKWMDAVVMILTCEIDRKQHVCLRTCVRPPLLLRREIHLPVVEEGCLDFLWELPAGLIEDREKGHAGIRARASAEALEEAGYQIAPDRFEILPGAPFVSPGVIPERLWYAHAVVEDPQSGGVPQGDGGAVEERGQIWWVNLEEAISMCDRGEVQDMKTELGLRRLAALENKDQENNP